MKSNKLIATTLAAIMLVGALSQIAGCTADPRGVLKAVKEVEPDAKKRNEEIRKLTGVPEDKNE